MKAVVAPYIPRPQRALRSVVVWLPSNHPKSFHITERQFDHWMRTSCNKTKLRRFGQEVAKKFGLPKPLVRRAGIPHRVSCFLYIYEGSPTPAKVKLFKKVLAYAEKHAPKGTKTSWATKLFGC